MNELTEAGSLSEAAGRRWGVQGSRGGLVQTLASDLFPMFDAGRLPIDLAHLAGDYAYGAIIGQGASVGNRSQAGLQLNVSNVLARVERVTINCAATTAWYLMLRDSISVALTTAARGWPRDTRRRVPAGNAAQSAVTIGSFAGAAVGAGGIVWLGTGPQTLNDLELVMDRPSQLFLETVLDNLSIEAAFMWRERRAGSWELGG